jgi:hypothetical protein
MKKYLIILITVVAASTAFAANVIKGSGVVAVQQEKIYKKIDVKDVPAGILKEITEKYPNYTVTQAAVSDDKEYKLSITDAKTPVTVYYDANGEFVKEQK